MTLIGFNRLIICNNSNKTLAYHQHEWNLIKISGCDFSAIYHQGITPYMWLMSPESEHIYNWARFNWLTSTILRYLPMWTLHIYIYIWKRQYRIVFMDQKTIKLSDHHQFQCGAENQWTGNFNVKRTATVFFLSSYYFACVFVFFLLLRFVFADECLINDLLSDWLILQSFSFFRPRKIKYD